VAADGRAAVTEVLEWLTEMGDDAIRRRAGGLADRCKNDRLRVLVVGEAKRGKSTLVNAMLGREVLPTGVVPLTAVPTTVSYGHTDHVRVEYRDGTCAEFSLDALSELVTERGNPGNRLGLRRVVVLLRCALLERGIELVDTPGTGSVHEANTAEAEAAIADMDAAIFVLTVDPPISAGERAMLARVSAASVATFVLLNKADRMAPEEADEATAFTTAVVAETTGRSCPVYLSSARQAAESGALNGPGLDEFSSAFESYLVYGRSAGLLESLIGHATALIDELRDEQQVTLRAIDLREETAGERVEAFAEKLTELGRHQRVAVDRVRGETNRLLTELDADATRVTARARRELTERASAELAGTGSPKAIDQAGRQWVAEHVVGYARTWRGEQARNLQQRLDALEAELRTDLDARLDALRPAARDLLGVELTPPLTAVELVGSRAFHFVTQQPPEDAALVRNRVPGRLGRRKALRHVLDQVAAQSGQHIGRARGDLQQRLTETARRFTGILTARYGDYADRLTRSLNAAAASRSEDELAGLRQELLDRGKLLAELRAKLTEIALMPTRSPTVQGGASP
jgi:GTP-binding protein EngB required for normal cell division